VKPCATAASVCTYGKLNATKPKQLLRRGRVAPLSGSETPSSDKFADPDSFLITVDALSNGVSISPSNSRVQPRMKFPRNHDS
jgi:homoserine O-acetyltransferase